MLKVPLIFKNVTDQKLDVVINDFVVYESHQIVKWSLQEWMMSNPQESVPKYQKSNHVCDIQANKIVGQQVN